MVAALESCKRVSRALCGTSPATPALSGRRVTRSVGAAILSNGSGAGGVYPQVMIQRQDYATAGLPTTATSAAQKYCEYGPTP